MLAETAYNVFQALSDTEKERFYALIDVSTRTDKPKPKPKKRRLTIEERLALNGDTRENIREKLIVTLKKIQKRNAQKEQFKIPRASQIA